jgi:hypothetical protein
MLQCAQQHCPTINTRDRSLQQQRCPEAQQQWQQQQQQLQQQQPA